MSSPHQPSPFDEYLNRIAAPLVGALPSEAIEQIKQESRLHLELLEQEIRQRETTPEHFARQAMLEYGNPELIGLQILQEHDRKPRSWLFGPPSLPAALACFIGFGAPVAAAFCIYGFGLMLPYHDYTQIAAAALLLAAPWVGGIFTALATPALNLWSILAGFAPVGLAALIEQHAVQPFLEQARNFSLALPYGLTASVLALLATSLLRAAVRRLVRTRAARQALPL